MALTPSELLRQQALSLDYDDVNELLRNAGLKGDIETLALDWTQKQTNINVLAETSTALEDQVAQNAQDISTNATDIGNNTTDIGNNTTNITANTDAIALANGQLVGNNDFATAGTGGVVLEAVNVADGVQSSVTVTSPDATDLTTVITLANETKSDVNQLVTDLNNAITQLNAFLAANQTAKQMAP